VEQRVRRAIAAVDVVTDSAAFQVNGGELVLADVADVMSLDWLREHTGSPYRVEAEERTHA
jgi:acyl CoA:acetate/3-ketoacid CoA transferase beta subunit